MDWKHLYLKTNHLIAMKKVGSLQCYCLVTCACTLVYFQRWPVPDVWESLTTQEHKRRGRWGLVGYLQSGNVHVHTIFFQQPLRVVVQPSQSFQLHLKLVKGTNKFWSHKVQCTCTACVFACMYMYTICSLGMYVYIHFFSTASKGGGATKSKLLAAPQTGKGHKQVLKPQGTLYMYSMCVCRDKYNFRKVIRQCVRPLPEMTGHGLTPIFHL